MRRIGTTAGISQRPALHQFVGQRDLADQRQQQRHGVVGDLADAVVRHVIDGDAFLLGGRQVDIVDAEAEAADRLALGELESGCRA